MERLSFYDQIDRNKKYSLILIVLVFLAVAALTALFAVIFAKTYGPGGMLIFMTFGTVFNVGYVVHTYYNSTSIALSAVDAVEARGPKYQQLRNVVEEMAISGGVAKPKTYVMPSQSINAFATGRDPEHSAVCVTEGAVEKLSREELQGVIAHEMTHVRNYDIRFATLVAVMVGLVSIMSQLFLRSMRFSGGGGRGRGKGGGAILLLILVGLILSIIAPILVKLVQLAISRKREFMADAGAVQLTRYPSGLIGALEKINAEGKAGMQTKVNEAVAPMFFSDPTKSRFWDVFDTHPPIEERIKILKSM